MENNDDDDYETLFKLRLPEKRTRILREIAWLLSFIFGLFLVVGIFMVFEYREILQKNPEITFFQYLKHENHRTKTR